MIRNLDPPCDLCRQRASTPGFHGDGRVRCPCRCHPPNVPVCGRIDSDITELRRIGVWLNDAHPTDEDSDGNRVLIAADEIERLQRAQVGRRSVRIDPQ